LFATVAADKHFRMQTGWTDTLFDNKSRLRTIASQRSDWTDKTFTIGWGMRKASYADACKKAKALLL